MKLVGIRNAAKKNRPSSGLAIDTDSTFVYQTGSDVQRTWRKFGWTPPTEYRSDYEFAKNRDTE